MYKARLATVLATAGAVTALGFIAPAASNAVVTNMDVSVTSSGNTVTGEFTNVVSSFGGGSTCRLFYTEPGGSTQLGGSNSVNTSGGNPAQASFVVPNGTWDIYGVCNDGTFPAAQRGPQPVTVPSGPGGPGAPGGPGGLLGFLLSLSGL